MQGGRREERHGHLDASFLLPNGNERYTPRRESRSRMLLSPSPSLSPLFAAAERGMSLACVLRARDASSDNDLRRRSRLFLIPHPAISPRRIFSRVFARPTAALFARPSIRARVKCKPRRSGLPHKGALMSD